MRKTGTDITKNGLATLLCCALLVATAAGAQKITPLKIGQSAPEFNLAGVDGKMHTLAEYANRAVRRLHPGDLSRNFFSQI